MDRDEVGRYENRYDMDVTYRGIIPDPGHELEEDELMDYVDTDEVRVHDWRTEPAEEGRVELTIEGHMSDRMSLDDAEDAIVDCNMRAELGEYSVERVWSD